MVSADAAYMIINPRAAQIVAPLAAAAFYGGWAMYSNWQFDINTVITAGIVQGGFAFISTLVLTSLVIYLLSRNGATPIKVFIQSSLALTSIPLLLHLSAGTPNILMAMLPGLIVGHIYLWGLIKKIPASQ
jgi:hypothetical protein